jgi:glucose/mannose-6-phosphate isomerase
MREWRPVYGVIEEDKVNPCEELAIRLLDKNVVIFGAGGIEVVARRWKAQIAELAKAWASFEAIPEMNHNTLAGLVFPENLLNDTVGVFLSASTDHARNRLRVKVNEELFVEAGIEVLEVFAKGESRLAQMWSLVQFGDYVAYYLALAYGVDPTPVDILTSLKRKLANA